MKQAFVAKMTWAKRMLVETFSPGLLTMLVFKNTPEPESCRLCNRDVSDPEDRARLAGANPWCDRGAARAVTTDGNGLSHPAQESCPYRGCGS